MPQDSAPEPDIDSLIASRVRALRAARGLTLEALAARSGVSRAMLSRIERGESSPTVGLLARLCGGLGVALPALMFGEAALPDAPLVRRADQPAWRDPASGYLRRAVLPARDGSGLEIAEIELPVGCSVLLDALGAAGSDRHLWVLDGSVEVADGGGASAINRGDRLRLGFEGPMRLRNAGSDDARCAVIVVRAGEGAA